MNYDPMRYLVEVYRTNSVTKAAENLYISQSTISKSLGKLQRTLGVELFHATKSGVEFTEIGKQVAKRSKVFLVELDRYNIDVEDIIKDDISKVAGELTIAATPVTQGLVLSALIPDFLNTCPKVTFQLKTVFSEDGLKTIEKGEADILLFPCTEQMSTGIALNERLQQLPLCNHVFAVAMHRSHPLRDKPLLSLPDILRYPWVSLSSRKSDSTMLSELYRMPVDILPNIVVHTTDLYQALETVRQTDCLAIVSNFARTYAWVRNGEIVLAPIKEAPSSTLNAIYASDSEKRELIEIFLRHTNLN